MRIISGTLGGRMINAPANLPVRPTTDFAKSGLFNILSNHFDLGSVTVLDLFCGIGSISLEFASRGAKEILCVDEHAGCLKFIREISDRFSISNLSTYKSEVLRFLRNNSRRFDIIFADPPFAWNETDRLPDIILENNMLSENGWLIVEHQSKRNLESRVKPFQVRKYGNCSFSFYGVDRAHPAE